MKIFIGADHTGFEIKGKLIAYLEGEGHEVADQGAFAADPGDDYPDFILPVARAVAADPASRGIVIGGSGQGEAIAANKVPGARAAVFYGPVPAQGAVDADGRRSDDPYEIVRLARMHNDANILSLGARFITRDQTHQAIDAFLNTPFSGEERHIRRLAEIAESEK